jgi:uncharacterized protein (TIGR02145 family)
MEGVKIGKQVWMKCNLDVDTFRNGDPIPQVISDEQWLEYGEQRKPAWCYYDNKPINGAKYGKLYNWYAVNDPRGLVPNGWHVPSDKEWDELIEYLGGKEEAGERLKATQGWEENGNGTDQVGFSGLPGGYRYILGPFNAIGYDGYWWSSNEFKTYNAWFRSLNCFYGFVYRFHKGKLCGFSVRCLRD